ncbi:MAG: GNAT family N-acetyltransferase [Bacteroidales bacterium]|nr:GNAT family N-acetyltransferase [Bacteroidales bacterium]
MKQSTEIFCSENLKLRLLTKEDAKSIFEAVSTQRNYLGQWFAHYKEPITLAKTQELVKQYTETQENPSDIIYLIFHSDEFVGFIGLKNIDWNNNKAELDCWIQEKHQHLGIMLESGSKFLEYVFRKLNFNRLEVKTSQNNTKLIDFTRRLGFSQEGIEKQGLRIDEKKYINLTIHSMVQNEYLTKLMFYRRGSKLKNEL